MLLIEPCCAPKNLLALRGKLGESGTAFFHGFGDLSLAELLPPMLTRYCQTEIMMALPALPDMAAETIRRILDKQCLSADGKSKIDVVKKLTLVTDLRKKKSPEASEWLKENPFGQRLELLNVQQNDTIILLPDIAFMGSINLVYGGHFTALATKNRKVMDELRKNLQLTVRR